MDGRSSLFDVIVIGGGAAGMMAAYSASAAGAKTLLIEKNKKLGTKVLASGNGRCNLTNKSISKINYYGSMAVIFDKIYNHYTNQDFIALLRSNNVDVKLEDRGRYFPKSDRASDVVDVFEKLLERNKVTLKLGEEVKNLTTTKGLFRVTTETTEFMSRNVVLTTGGKASHHMGSSGDGLFWALKLGHKPSKLFASLSPLISDNPMIRIAMGVKLKTETKLEVNKKQVATNSGDLLFTHFGLSGPAAMCMARFVDPAIEKSDLVELKVNILPKYNHKKLTELLINLSQQHPKRKLSNILGELLPSKLVDFILKTTNQEDIIISEVSKNKRNILISNILELPINIVGVKSFKESQVTSGGITAEEVTGNLESRIIPGLYFAGEILDIDGDSGGFNLQWAWSSGNLAGIMSARRIDEG